MSLDPRRLPLLWLAACSAPCQPVPVNEPPEDLPPTAKVDVWRSMADDLVAPRSPSDGGGKAVILDGPEGPVQAGSSARWRFQYTAGPSGIAVGGALYFQGPPFWGWSPPQVWETDLPGYTEAHTDASGVTLSSEAVGQGLLKITVQGRALAAGEEIEVAYGIGEAGVDVDRYAEREERFWFSVDGDGDGVRKLVPDPPVTSIIAGPAAGLVVTVPTTARPGESVRVTVAALDVFGNAGAPVSGEVELYAPPELGLPDRVSLGSGSRSALMTAPLPGGMYRVGARVGDAMGLSDPVLVHAEAPPILWADLQVHTALSDGTGSLDDAYAYAHDVAGLDAVAITDHDHWGMELLDAHPERWQEIVDAADRWDEPGSFVAFPAYEWTSWLYGHRHVLYVGAPGPAVSSLPVATRDPDGLWRALAPYDAITIAHHTAGGPVAMDWRFHPDPRVEPVTEIVSVHGSSESEDTPVRIYGFVPGNTVRDALAGGHRFGFIGSSDGHDGHPGLAQLQAAQGGVAALFTADRSRAGVAQALRERRGYATSGPRLLLRTRLDGVEMGGTLAPTGAASELEVRVVAGDPVERIDVIRGLDVVEQHFVGVPAVRKTFSLAALAPGEFVYVRVLLSPGGVAWSSPVFVAEPAAP